MLCCVGLLGSVGKMDHAFVEFCVYNDSVLDCGHSVVE